MTDQGANAPPPGGYPVGKGPDPKRAALFMKLGIISENGAYMPKARQTQEEPTTMTGLSDDAPGPEATPSPSSSFDIQMDEKPIKPKDDFRVAYLKRLSKEGIWLPPDKRPPKHQIVIIFDWDDTLLCTSFLNCRGIHQLPKNMTAVLDQLQEKAANLLDIALKLSSNCFIITNAMKGWVEYSCEKFVPKLMPYLDKMEVISARTDHEQEFPQNFHEWKNQAFLNVQKKLHQQIIANLISLGDSNFEMEAVHVMGAEFQQALIKTIKFRESPTPEELVKQYDFLLFFKQIFIVC
mgnify:CR=1 FL=1